MKKGRMILLTICTCSLCFVLGMFVGRNLTKDYTTLPQSSTIDTIPITDEIRDFRININEATKTQLMELPGIGETIAQRIIDYREQNGSFHTTDDLMNVEGIGAKKLQAIIELIKVGG